MADDPTRSDPAARPDITRSIQPTDPNVTRSRPNDPQPAAPPDGLVLPGYTLLGELGRGGMGVVYRGRHERLKREVAVKVIATHAGPAARDRFRREAEAVAALNHSHVVQIFEVGEAGGVPFLAFELVPGGTLADLVSSGPLPARRAAELVAPVAAAVQAAHARGIVHRDLKPGNVLLAADGSPKVADFGLAKWYDSDTGPTATNQVLGTPAYMAPEQCRGDGSPVGPAADVYALGGVLYHLLTGRPPFSGPSPVATLRRVLDDDPVPPRQLRPDVPGDLEAVCLKCLEKEPRRRYPSAAAVADDLARFLAGEPVQARPPGFGRRTVRWVSRRRVGVVVGFTLLLAIAVVWMARRPDGPPPSYGPEAVAQTDEEVAAEIRSLIPEAAGQPREDLEEIGMVPDWNPKNQTLTSVLPRQSGKGSDFRFLDANKNFMIPIMQSKDKGYGTVLQPEFISGFSCRVGGDTAEGVIWFKADGYYEGRVGYTARRVGGRWRVEEFQLRGTGLRVYRIEGGTWRSESTDVNVGPPTLVEHPPVKLDGGIDEPAEMTTATLERVKAAVVLVRVTRPGGATASGTGFVAGDSGLIVTCAHVLGPLGPGAPPPESVEVVVGSGTARPVRLAARVQSVDRDGDVAFLQVPAAGLPDPLSLRPAGGLKESQTVYFAGYPLGWGLGDNGGPELAVHSTRLTTLRLNETGYITALQVQVSATPGQSGGPLVDTAGRVIGLMRALTGSDRRTALLVSGDLLSYLMTERVRWVQPGQAVEAGGRVTQPVTVRAADPFNRLAAVELEVWTGLDKPAVRPAADRDPPAVTGDSERQVVTLHPKAGDPTAPGEDRDFAGTLDLPPLPAGKVYWVRPRLKVAGRWRWAEAVVLRNGTRPVEAAPADLTVRAKAGRWAVELACGSRGVDETGGGFGERDLMLRTLLAETAASADGKGTDAAVRLSYAFRKADVVIGSVTTPLNNASLDPLRAVTPTATVGRDGLLRPDPLDTAGVPEKSRRVVAAWNDSQMGALAELTFPRPNKQVRPGEEWAAETVLRFAPSPAADAPAGPKLDAVKYRLVHRLLGTRERDGRAEAVVEITSRRPRTGPADAAVRVRGAALIDLDTGTVTLARVVTEFSGVRGTTTDGKPVWAGGRETRELRRTPGDVPANGAWEWDLLPDQAIEFAPVGRR